MHTTRQQAIHEGVHAAFMTFYGVWAFFTTSRRSTET